MGIISAPIFFFLGTSDADFDLTHIFLTGGILMGPTLPTSFFTHTVRFELETLLKENRTCTTEPTTIGKPVILIDYQLLLIISNN